MNHNPVQPQAKSDAAAAPLPEPIVSAAGDEAAKLLAAQVVQPPAEPGALAQIGAYQIIREIGRGGMGIVFLARHAQTGESVAIKTIRHEFAKRDDILHLFSREMSHMQRLNHPHVLSIREVVAREVGGDYYVMPFIEAGSLASLIRRNQPLPATEIPRLLRLAQQVTSALQFAWETHSLIHRDVSPENVLLSRDAAGNDHALVADFGLVKTMEYNETILDGAVTSLKRVGKPTYMAPEVASNMPGDVRADIYSFGASLYHILSGKMPYEGAGKTQIMAMLRDPNIRPLPLAGVCPGIDANLAAFIDRCMAYELKDRYATWKDVAGDLHRLIQGEPLHTVKTIMETPGPQTSSISAKSAEQRGSNAGLWLGLAASLLLVAGLIVGGWLILKGENGTTTPPTDPSKNPPLADGPTINDLKLEVAKENLPPAMAGLVSDFTAAVEAKDPGKLKTLLERIDPAQMRSFKLVGTQLFLTAIDRGDVAIVQALREKGVTVDAKDLWRWRKVLITLIRQGNHKQVLSMILAGVPVTAEPTAEDPEPESPIHVAASLNRVEYLDELVRAGASVTHRDRDLATPLHSAAMTGAVDAGQWLISASAPVNDEDKLGRTPLHRAAEGNHDGFVAVLLTHGADPEKRDKTNKAPADVAAAVVVQELLSGKRPIPEMAPPALIELVGKPVTAEKVLPIVDQAVSQGRVDLLKLALDWLEKPARAELYKRNSDVLLRASLAGKVEIVRELRTRKYSFDNANQTQANEALLTAVTTKERERIQCLLLAGASLAAREPLKGHTALHIAAAANDAETAALLLNHEVPLDGRDESQNTPLHVAAREGAVAIVDLLIQQSAVATGKPNGDFINAVNNRNRTALMEAVQERRLPVVRALLAAGAKTDIADNQGKSALDILSTAEIEKLLKEPRAKQNP